MPRYLVHSRAAEGGGDAVDDALTQRHWRYMDRYAEAMTLRGPTLAEDSLTWTGSVHVVDLPGPGSAARFVVHEPYNRAGVYASHRTWDVEVVAEPSPAEVTHPDPRFLVLATGAGGTPISPPDPDHDLTGRLVLLARLRDVDDGTTGLAVVLHAPSRAAVGELLDGVPTLGEMDHVEVHDWQPGGRR